MTGSLGNIYDLGSAADAEDFYDGWAAGYEDEIANAGYITPQRCAEALTEHAAMPWAPLLEVGCGTGLGGLALRAAGFSCIDGFDISPEMLARTEDKDIYRSTDILDLSQSLDAIELGTYQNAAAIGVLNPSFMPSTVIDEIVSKLPPGGCFVCSLNDKSGADGTFEARIFEITETGAAELLIKDHGDHLPGIGLQSTVYLLKVR